MSSSGYAIGIDCGSTFCKGALFSKGEVKALAAMRTGWDIAKTGVQVMAELLGTRPSLGLTPGQGLPLVVTGYGREKIQGDKIVTEITCHARGAQFLAPQADCVIDIGGQDYKIIKTDNGKVMSFQMNDKCAAGTGRFLEMVLNRLEIDLSQMDGLLALGKAIKLNSTCVVFAESEIIGLLAQGLPREEILGGVVSSMATKISSQAARLGLTSPAVLTGGFAASRGICQILSKALEIKVQPLSDGIYAGAIGAACLALEL